MSYTPLSRLDKHFHSAMKVYPTLAAILTINKVNAVAWGLDATTTEIIPAGTVTAPFDIHFVNIQQASVADEFELLLFSGAVGLEVEIGRISFDRTGSGNSEDNVSVMTPVQPANSRISAKLTAQSAAARNVAIKLHYHTY